MSTRHLLVDYIRNRGVARSDELDEKFMLTKHGGATALLRDLVFGGALVACQVAKPGRPEVTEYRVSALHGGKLTIGAVDTMSREGRKRARGLAAMHAAKRRGAQNAAAQAGVSSVSTADTAPAAGRAPVADSGKGTPAAAAPTKPPVTKPAPVEEADVTTEKNIGDILKDVPLPPKGSDLQLALRAMVAGDCRDIRGYAKSGIYNAAKHERCKIVVAPIKGGFRVWRVEG